MGQISQFATAQRATALLVIFVVASGSSSSVLAQPQPAPAKKNPAAAASRDPKAPAPANDKTADKSAPATPAATSSDAAILQYRGAVAFHNQKQYDFAVEDWERFLEKFPNDPLAPKARHYAGVCYLQLKQFDKAIAAFEQVTSKQPKFEMLEASLTNLGLSYFEAAKAGKPELHAKAAATFETLLNQFPKSAQAPVALYYQAEALYNAGKRDEAIKSYQELVDKHPLATQRADALYALAVTLQELDKQDQAGAAYDTFLKEYSKHPLATEIAMRKGDVLLANKKYSEAEKQFAAAAAIQDFKLADYAMLRQALAQYEQKEYPKAAATYAALVNKYPQSEHARAATLSAGNCYYLANQQGEARTWLAKVIAAGGDNAVEAAHWTARSYLKDKQPAKALETVEQVLAKGDAAKSPSLHLLKLDQADAVFEIDNRRKEAVALYAEVAKQFADSPSASQALYMAGFTALNVGQYDDAQKHAAEFRKRHADHTLSPDVKFVAAESLLQLGKPADAEKLYAELIDKHSNRTADLEQWQVRRGLSLFLQKRYDDLIKQLGPLVAKFKNPSSLAEARYLLGSSQFELKQYGDAVQSFNASIAADAKWPQADEALLGLSRAQRAAGDVAAAKSSVERLLKDYPQSNILDRAHFRLGEYQFAAGEFKPAIGEYQWVLDKAPNSALAAHAWYGMGLAQLSQQDYAAAEKSFSSLLEKHKDHALTARTQNARASARLQKKDFAGAMADANAYLKAEPDGTERSDARFVMGLAQVGDNKLDEAIKTFEAILKDDAKYVGADKVLFELGWAAKNVNNEGAAAQAFKRLAEEYSDSPLAIESQYLVGEQQYAAKDYKQAAAAYEAVLKKTGKSAGKTELGEKARHKLAWALYQQNNFEGAEQAFSQQLADNPQGTLAADATYMQAESLFKLAKYDAASTAFDKALLLKPSSADFVALGLLHAGQAAAQRKKWDDSLKLLARLTTDHPDSTWVPEALYEQGWAQQNRGKLDEASKLYEAAAEKAPSREVGARARFMIGEVLFEQGNHKDAVRSFFKVAYGFGDANTPDSIKVWQANATYESARCFEVLKNVEQAKKLYAELIEKYPSSDKSELAKQRLAALAKG